MNIDFELYCLEVCLLLRRTIAPDVPLAWIMNQQSVQVAYLRGQTSIQLVNETIQEVKRILREEA